MMTTAIETAEIEISEPDKFQVMPPLADEEFTALMADIRANGLLIPVEVDEAGNVLDGHHRVRACNELGIEWPVNWKVREGLTEAEKRRHALALNIKRRHLTGEQKRGLVAQQLVDAPERSDRSIANDVGVSDHTVNVVRKKMVATAQIAQLDKTVGKDGKERPASKPKATCGSKPSKRTAPADAEPSMPAPADETFTPEDDEREVAGELDARLLDDVGRRLLAAAQRYAEVIDEALARPEGENPVTTLSDADFTGLKAACSRIALFRREFGL